MKKNNFFLQTEKQRALFIEIILDGLNASSAVFMCWAYPIMINKERNAKELGSAAHMTNGAALIHLKRLQSRGFVERKSFRAWCLTNKALTCNGIAP